MTNYPETFTLVQIHVGDAYATTWGNTRASFYIVTGTPTSVFDGVNRAAGVYSTLAATYNWYRDKYDTQAGVATNISVAMKAELISGSTYEVTVTYCKPVGAANESLVVYTVQVLDHWPTTGGYHRNGFKQAASTASFTLHGGECVDVVRQFTFDATSMASPDDIKIITWAQRPHSALKPDTVFQANRMSYPFAAGDVDGDGDVNLEDYETFVECLNGPDLGEPPTGAGCEPADFVECDMDDDDDVDMADYAVFMTTFTGG